MFKKRRIDMDIKEMEIRNNTVHEYYEEKFKNNCYNMVHYYINHDKKTIACRIFPSTDVLPFQYKLTFDKSLNVSFFEYCSNYSISFIGKATCFEPDEFNIEFGKKLAYDKAMFKFINAKRKFLYDTLNDLKDEVDQTYSEIDKLQKFEDRVYERFSKKIKEIM